MAAACFTAACLWGRTRPGFAGAMAMALRSVRGIFRHVHAATKNDPFLSAADGGGNQEGAPAPSWTLPGTVGRGTGARWGACFCRGCLLSGSPRSGIAGGRAAAAAGRETRGRAHALRCAPGDEGRETGDGRGRSAARLGTRDERRGNRERPGAPRRGGFYFFRPR